MLCCSQEFSNLMKQGGLNISSGKAAKPPRMPSPSRQVEQTREESNRVPPVLHLSELQSEQEIPESERGQRELSPTLERSPLFNSLSSSSESARDLSYEWRLVTTAFTPPFGAMTTFTRAERSSDFICSSRR